tara:strand:- start:2741 stop:3778 length:1038 start_codon:yes stop_codon:yes gene_type:complete
VIKVGIVGGTGYTGVELLRILVHHPETELKVITSRSEEGVRVDDMYPNLRGYTDLAFTVPDADALGECDVVFFATPHGVAHALAEEVLNSGARVVDLSADFRLKDVPTWEKWYGQEHGAPGILPEAVYGLPEVYRSDISKARLVACPGCYPTSVELGLIPLIEQGLIEDQLLIADCKTGVSGAGRGAKVGSLFAETADSFMAYGTSGHRHLPEIRQELKAAAGGKDINITFTPHLAPMIRGILATLYAQVPEQKIEDLQKIYEERYANEPFVDVLPAGSQPATRSVKGSNVCRLALHYHEDTGQVIVLSAIDNLVKGSSGQAVQCMNIMFGLEENMGLQHVALMP